MAETASMKLLTFLLAFLFLTFPAIGQTTKTEESPATFVQSFYNWYLSIEFKEKKESPCILALREKGAVFSAQLKKALLEDDAAAKKNPDEIVGLDFDPFLNSQDPEKVYKVGEVAPRGKNFWVNVHAVHSGTVKKQPDVIVEVAKANGHWVFVNFHSPTGPDLMQVLKTLAKDRCKSRR